MARHAGTGEAENFASTFSALGKLAYEGAQVSASVVDLNSGKTLLAIDDRIVLPTASIGKILLLIEVSARLTSRDFSGYGILDKTPRDAVGDSGIADPAFATRNSPVYSGDTIREWGGNAKKEYCRADTGTVTIFCRALVATAGAP